MGMKFSACQCEHNQHFNQPCQGHAYGQEFDVQQLVKVVTPYGTFDLCQACDDSLHMRMPVPAEGTPF